MIHLILHYLNTKPIHSSWLPLIEKALAEVDPAYLVQLRQDTNWLPGPDRIFNAFSLPLVDTRYILFGEAPYPRAISANGYAFWDAAVHAIWSEKGLSTTVNRATSLRNIIKMLLVAENQLSATDTGQAAIATINKNSYIQTLEEVFINLQKHGVLLLNASLVYRKNLIRKDSAAWLPFINKLLELLAKQQPQIELILLGKVAQTIAKLSSATSYKQFHAEHPYNHSFINNQKVLALFRPMLLLRKN